MRERGSGAPAAAHTPFPRIAPGRIDATPETRTSSLEALESSDHTATSAPAARARAAPFTMSAIAGEPDKHPGTAAEPAGSGGHTASEGRGPFQSRPL